MSVPTVLPAPTRLSTMICWPRPSLIFEATVRPMMSTPPPAANGTTIRIGRTGYALAALGAAEHTPAANVQPAATTMGKNLFISAPSGDGDANVRLCKTEDRGASLVA